MVCRLVTLDDTPQLDSYSFGAIVAFIREFSGIRPSQPIMAKTRLNADLGITGDDGRDLLYAAVEQFHVDLVSLEKGIAQTLELAPNECFFPPEGFDLFGIALFVRWVRGEPRWVYRDLTVGELYESIRKAPINTPKFVNADE